MYKNVRSFFENRDKLFSNKIIYNLVISSFHKEGNNNNNNDDKNLEIIY